MQHNFHFAKVHGTGEIMHIEGTQAEIGRVNPVRAHRIDHRHFQRYAVNSRGDTEDLVGKARHLLEP
jgi:hypothetical protein